MRYSHTAHCLLLTCSHTVINLSLVYFLTVILLAKKSNFISFAGFFGAKNYIRLEFSLKNGLHSECGAALKVKFRPHSAFYGYYQLVGSEQ